MEIDVCSLFARVVGHDSCHNPSYFYLGHLAVENLPSHSKRLKRNGSLL